MKLGIDLGGTKIEAAVLDERGEMLSCRRISTPQQGYQATLNAISALVGLAKKDMGISPSSPVGIGTPGALTLQDNSLPAVMKNCNSTALNGKPLQQDLSDLLTCPVVIANDANCFALAEALSGQGRKLFKESVPESVFGVILGTGVGAGVVINGRILQGRHAIGGEWGHNTLPAEELDKLPAGEKERRCYCGRYDCIETYLSGPGLALSYQLRFNDKLSPENIIAKMRSRDSKAQEIWMQYIEQLACALSVVVNILDPTIIVLGGGLSNIEEIYGSIAGRMRSRVFSNTFDAPIVPALLGDSAGVYGAAWLA